jgi:uncharacterized membrane protein YdjX (TVP38/TMEM64 family)
MSEEQKHLEPRPGELPDEGTSTWLALAISVGAALVVVAMVLALNPLRDAVSDALHGDTGALRDDLDGLGASGVAIVLALALAHSVILYPVEILNAAAGYVFGFWLALPLMMLGWLLNGILCHQIGRYGGRPLLLKILREDRFLRWERAVERGGPTLLIAIRLVPVVPFSLVSYVLGSAGVPIRTFVWTTIVGFLPLTILFVLLGSRLEDISPTDPVIWGGAAVMIALLVITRKVLPMIERREDAETGAPRAPEEP